MKSPGKLLLFLPAFVLALPLVSSAQQGNQATIRVKVPANATVTIDTLPTRQGGTERLYETPPLTPGGTFTYQLEATWTENGKTRKVALEAKVRAGQTTRLDFTDPFAGAERIGEPKKILPPKKEEVKETPPTKKSEPKKVDAPTKAEPAIDKKTETKKVDVKKVDAPKKIDDKKDPAIKKDDAKSASAQGRNFLFTYAGVVKDLKPGQEASVWLPMAASSAEQDASVAIQDVPSSATTGKDKEYGNRILHFTAKANDKGEIPFKVVYKVSRQEVKTDATANVTVKAEESKDLLSRFLQPDTKVPTSGKPLELIKDRKLPGDQFASAKILYDMVNSHMKYSKEGTGWGRGDAVWACDSKFGNCSDFHSLFISMARGNKIPSKFEMGFPLPPKRGNGTIGGYHCWAWFLPAGKGWVPVDISEANRHPELREYYFGNLTEDRVLFSRGRDITLEPPQKGSPLNFFIYPYVEVNGQPHEKVDRTFAFEDLS